MKTNNKDNPTRDSDTRYSSDLHRRFCKFVVTEWRMSIKIVWPGWVLDLFRCLLQSAEQIVASLQLRQSCSWPIQIFISYQMLWSLAASNERKARWARQECNICRLMYFLEEVGQVRSGIWCSDVELLVGEGSTLAWEAELALCGIGMVMGCWMEPNKRATKFCWIVVLCPWEAKWVVEKTLA